MEARNFDMRKHLLDYDDVMNKHREIIYSLRKSILEGKNFQEILEDMIDQKIEDLIEQWIDPKAYPEDWNLKELNDSISWLFGFPSKIGREEMGEEAFDSLKIEALPELIKKRVLSEYREREKLFGREDLARLERYLILQIIDDKWVAHLQAMDHMKEGIGLRGYGQLDPLKEYQKEGFALFGDLMGQIREETLRTLFRIQIVREEPDVMPKKKKRALNLSHGDGDSGGVTVRRKEQKVGRNAPCPCGSGKKYKKCCGIGK